jgi:2-hydroxychromene-2-carboxylate isomerase
MPIAVDYYISLNSPWTYLGSARFREMARRYGVVASVKPARFGEVFAQTGGLPLPKRSLQRQAYRMMELQRWRDHLGIAITIEPKFFPANEQAAAHLVIVAGLQERDTLALAHEIGKAQWELEQDIGQMPVLIEAGKRAGVDVAAVMRAAPPAAELDAIWDRNTKDAVERGVFGAPTYALPTGELFWGQDRLDFVERALAKLA